MAGQNGGPLVLGIDLGGTKVVAGVVDAEHQILGRAKRPTPAKEGAAAILAALRRRPTRRSSRPACGRRTWPGWASAPPARWTPRPG